MKSLFILFFCFAPLAFVSGQSEYFIYKEFDKYPGAVTAVNYSPSGRYLLSGTGEGLFFLTRVEEEEVILEKIIHTDRVKDIVPAPIDTQYFFTTGDNEIKMWDYNLNVEKVYQGNNTYGWSISVSHDQKYLACGSFEKHFRIWDIKSRGLLHTFSGHEKSVLSVAFHPYKNLVASGSLDESIKVWDIATTAVIDTFLGHYGNIYDLEYTPDGKYLVSCAKDKTIKIWDIENDRFYKTLTDHDHAVMCLSISPNGYYIVSGSYDQTVRLWEIHTGNNIYTFRYHEGPVNDVAFSPDGKYFASGSNDESCIIWQTKPELFVDYYFQEEFFEELKASGLAEEKRKGESRGEYKERMIKAEEFKQKLYQKYYQKYLEKRDKGSLK